MNDTLGQWVVPFTNGRWTLAFSLPAAVAAGWGFTWGLEHNLYATAGITYVLSLMAAPMFAHAIRVRLTAHRMWMAIARLAIAQARGPADLGGQQL